ncbi:MAG TPA: hypothetical protein VJ279_11875 [Hanamia sp.]|jgi:hypothetical protein|nr:hypothetical protein [Hanamia sp.]
MNEKQESYIFGRLHENLLQVQKDLHLADPKAALLKINDALKLIEEKVEGIFPIS